LATRLEDLTKLISQKKYFCHNDGVKKWLVKPLIKALQNPQPEPVNISKEVFKKCKQVVVLNCIDSVYGHCLLKLLNAQRHLDYNPDHGLVVIVQQFKRAMVPDGVAGNLDGGYSLSKGQYYYPNFSQFVCENLSDLIKFM
jgi:hypothetical protein